MGFWAEQMDEDAARRVADIIGPASAIGRALDELHARRAKGERLLLMKRGSTILIVPEADVSNVIQPEFGAKSATNETA